MAIYLLRHGETEWNREEKLQGNIDVPLNRAGLHQARRLAHRFRKVQVSVVFTSPLSRARYTALIIGHARKWPVVVDDHLREIDHGMWTGLTARSIARRFPNEFAIWRSNPDGLRLSGAERLGQAYGRAAGFLSRITATRFRGDVLIVSHGVINALLLCGALGLSPARVWEFPQPNGCINLLRLQRRRIVAFEELKDGSG